VIIGQRLVAVYTSEHFCDSWFPCTSNYLLSKILRMLQMEFIYCGILCWSHITHSFNQWIAALNAELQMLTVIRFVEQAKSGHSLRTHSHSLSPDTRPRDIILCKNCR